MALAVELHCDVAVHHIEGHLLLFMLQRDVMQCFAFDPVGDSRPNHRVFERDEVYRGSVAGRLITGLIVVANHRLGGLDIYYSGDGLGLLGVNYCNIG